MRKYAGGAVILDITKWKENGKLKIVYRPHERLTKGGSKDIESNLIEANL